MKTHIHIKILSNTCRNYPYSQVVDFINQLFDYAVSVVSVVQEMKVAFIYLKKCTVHKVDSLPFL